VECSKTNKEVRNLGKNSCFPAFLLSCSPYKKYVSRMVKMQKIISVSRRTDIPAFFGEWFLNRVNEGFAGYLNPFSGTKHFVSLKNDDVTCFVFWSKNFVPFMDILKKIDSCGYNFYFNYTINNYPDIFEGNVINSEKLIDNLKELSDLYSPLQINWRYDPIIVSNLTDFDFHLKNFYSLASKLTGYVKRCIFSYVSLYKKVKRNFISFCNIHNIEINEPQNKEKVEFANELYKIAEKFNIKLFSCCSPIYLGENIQKARCVDHELINKLFFDQNPKKFKIKSSREYCNCSESIDIGVYDTCRHSCVYCYANKNFSLKKNKNFDRYSSILSYNKKEADYWVNEYKKKMKS
jgi:hypothetical protein